MPGRKKRKAKAMKKVVDLAKKGTKFNIHGISPESLQGMATSGQKHTALVVQAKKELEERLKTQGNLKPRPKHKSPKKKGLNALVAKLFG